jgi:hypothetical protein
MVADEPVETPCKEKRETMPTYLSGEKHLFLIDLLPDQTIDL